MSFGIALAIIGLATPILSALLAGRFCHMDDLERDPLDTSLD